MPVLLEQISQPNPQDIEDLRKIYSDYPSIGDSTADGWLEQQFEKPGFLMAGRFNGRLLAALWVTPINTAGNNDWSLEHLCVRNITRRRGVASQLIKLLCVKAHKEHRQITVNNNTTTEATQALLATIGFVQDPSNTHWVYDGR